MKYRWINGVRMPKFKSCKPSNFSSVGCSIPNRTYTIGELAQRLASGQPMPQLTFYRQYDDIGLRQVVRPTDLLSAHQLAESLAANEQQINDLKKELENVRKSSVSEKSASQEDRGE